MADSVNPAAVVAVSPAAKAGAVPAEMAEPVREFPPSAAAPRCLGEAMNRPGELAQVAETFGVSELRRRRWR